MTPVVGFRYYTGLPAPVRRFIQCNACAHFLIFLTQPLKGFLIDDQALFAVRKADEVFVYLNQCPHRGIALEWLPDQFLDAEKQYIQCATHGALFTIEQGECVAGPCPGERLTAITCELRDSEVWIDLTSASD